MAPFRRDETKMALKAIEKNKALGPDGFSMEFFFLQSWLNFSSTFWKQFYELHNNGRAMGFRGIF